MEPVGLAVGIVGLAGLFDATMNAIDRIKTYKEHDRDAERLASQIQGHKVALQDWRAKVGLDAQNGLDGKHSRRLDETKTRESVERLLKALLRDLGSGDDGGIGGALAVRTANNDQEAAPTGNKEKAAGKSRKLGWALGGKKDHVEKEAAVRELLKQLRILVPPDEERLLDSQRKTDEFHALYTEETRREVHKWIMGASAVSPSGTLREISDKKVDGTCEWLSERQGFQEWADTQHSSTGKQILWIHAAPGFGKTHLFSHAVQRINQKTTIVYFYFTSSLEVRSDPTIIFRSWLSQLAELDADIFKLVHGKRRSSADMQVATRPIIQDLLREAIKHDPRCHLAVDGLDECTSTKLDTGADVPPGVASFLETTISLMERPTRLLVVSRRIEEIWDALSHQESVLQLEVTEEHTLKDCGRLARWITTRNLAKKKPDIRQDVSKAMMQKSGGQLLWIHLAGAGLRSGANRQSLLRSIEATPHKLFEVYEHIWQSRIAGQPRSIELLRWVIFAWRPLTVQELTAAALIREGNEDVYEDEFPDEDDEWDEVNHQYRSGILQPCGEFLQLHERVWELCGYDNERGNWGMMRTHPNEYRYWIVTPAHDTVREFLHRKLTSLPVWQAAGLDSCAQEDWARPAGEDLDLAERQQHHILGRLCLRVVQSCPTWQEIQFCSSWYIAPSRRGLGLYSAARGFRHLSTATLLEEDSGTMENLLYFLDDRNQTYHDWSDWATTYTLPPQGTWELAKPELSRAKKDPILCAAILSLEPTTSQLLQRFMTRQSPEIVKQKATEMLNICCSDVKITMLAIDAGADPNNPHPNRFPALTISCVSGRLDIAALLLAAGADVRGTTEDTPSRPFPICFAAASGQWDSFQLLSRHGADLRSTWGGCTLMHFAANSDCIEVAEFLLGQGMVDMLCAVDDYGRTPLGVAAAFSSFKVAQFLVRNGVGVSEEDEGDSLVASAAGSISVMADLLNNNRYINPAPADAKMKTTELLISHGAKINGRSRDGITGLLAAAMEGQYDVMEFLLGKGADATMRDADDSTAWSYLARGYWHLWRLTGDEGKRLADIVDMLVGAGLGIDAVDGSGSTPLIMAARLGHAILTNVLLCKGANIDAVNYAGETAVNSAAGRGHLKVVEYLVSMEADINIPDAKGRSPATNASIGGHAGVVGFLAEHGAVVDEAVLDGERLNQDRNDTNVEEYKAISRFIRRARCLDGTI